MNSSWRVDETYVLVAGQWKYLYRAVDRPGQAVDFLLTPHGDVAAARRLFECARTRKLLALIPFLLCKEIDHASRRSRY